MANSSSLGRWFHLPTQHQFVYSAASLLVIFPQLQPQWCFSQWPLWHSLIHHPGWHGPQLLQDNQSQPCWCHLKPCPLGTEPGVIATLWGWWKHQRGHGPWFMVSDGPLGQAAMWLLHPGCSRKKAKLT